MTADGHEAGKPKATLDQAAVEGPAQLTDQDCPIVGIGASAGGLAAFEAFFSGMPPDADPGMAFVLIQHLAPDHKSILTDLVRRYTRMQVFEVEDGMAAQPNCTYIIPPNRDMAILHGTLQLLEPDTPRGRRLPIDFFFRSLAEDQRERAICIVLSGTGSDGTLGARAIKGEGGIVMVQNPASTEYDGMPCSVIATGLADYVLPPAEMPAQLIGYVARAFCKPRFAITPMPEAESAAKKLFILLRGQTGHDFSQYKPSTIHRRIERRMAVHQIESIGEYVKYVQKTPKELETLFCDLLIGVTSFFRDPEAFQALEEKVIPKLFGADAAGTAVRVWVPGCSTGEEAYSIAILLAERQEVIKRSFTVQVFATDIDSRSIATARGGLYPVNIAANVSPQRLARFFTAEPGANAYRIHKRIRDLIVFSQHDVIRDPPFSKLDLISCRNLLIYMGRDLHKKLIPLFHYALNAGGLLFLGTSETVGEFGDLFAGLDRKAKLYQRMVEDVQHAHHVALGRFVPPLSAVDATASRTAGKVAGSEKSPLRELTEQALLQQVAPAAALVNNQGDILYLHGRTGLYLEPAPGEAGINNILKMAREGLRSDLTAALHKATRTTVTVHCPGVRVKTNGDFTVVNLTIRPVTAGPGATPKAPLYLIVLEVPPPLEPEQAAQATQPAGAEPGGRETDSDARIAALERELRTQEEFLQTSNEELKSSNEEMQSVNEELQSTNEELETSKEELQSVNEELATVNAELQTKVADLSQANNDMNNLLAGTGIATVFVDHQLRILRFTPATTQITNLMLSDVGRPLSHLAFDLAGYDGLVRDTRAVLDSLVSKETEVRTQAGEWCLVRILPYRTLGNVIEGAVITFIDISEMKKAQAALREATLNVAALVRDSLDAILVRDLQGRILAWNPGATTMYGWSEAEALSMNIRELIAEAEREEELSVVQRLSRAETLQPYRARRIAKDGQTVEVVLTASALVNETGKVYAIATTERRVKEEAHV